MRTGGYPGFKVILSSMSFMALTSLACGDSSEVGSPIFHLETDMIIDGAADLDHFFTPFDLAVDSEGKIFILDFQQMIILTFNDEGDFMYQFGGKGGGPGEFNNLFFNFDLDDNGLVYTVDVNNIIKVFDNDGSFRCTIKPSTGEIFDIAALDSSRIYINCFPWGPELMSNSRVPAVTLIDDSGSVIRETGVLETESDEIGMRRMLFSCAIDTDEDNSLYYTSLLDYEVHKYDSSGAFVWSEEGPSTLTAYSERNAEGGNLLYPVVWDLDVDRDQVFVLWAQDGDERGYRVDVFHTDTGEFTGFFYTGTRSEENSMSIEIEGSDFYTIDYDFGLVQKYSMSSQ